MIYFSYAYILSLASNSHLMFNIVPQYLWLCALLLREVECTLIPQKIKFVSWEIIRTNLHSKFAAELS